MYMIFYGRQQFLDTLKKKNEKFIEELYVREAQEKVEEEKRQEAIARSEFNELAKNLHHLSSTHQTPGVYNPPYAHQKPQAFNIDVEIHLKATFKANYKWKPPTKDDIQKYTIRPQKPGQLKPLSNRPNSATGKNGALGQTKNSQYSQNFNTQKMLRQTAQ